MNSGGRSSSKGGSGTSLPIEAIGSAPVFAAKGESTEYEDWAEPVKLVALTFDDGPGAYTEYLLDELAERDVHATFFMVGRNTTGKFKPLVERAISEGHQVASHSYKHAYLTKYSASGMKNDLEKTAAALNDAAGGSFSYMLRPPYGAKNSTLLKSAGVPLIIWSVDPYDWKYRDAQVVSQSVINSARRKPRRISLSVMEKPSSRLPKVAPLFLTVFMMNIVYPACQIIETIDNKRMKTRADRGGTRLVRYESARSKSPEET